MLPNVLSTRENFVTEINITRILLFTIVNCLKPVVALFSILYPTDPPSAPKDLSVTNTDSGKVTLEWQAPAKDGGSPITGYIIQMAPKKSKDYVGVGKVDGNTTQYEATGLKEGAEYMFRVKAENVEGTSAESAKLEKPVKASPMISKFM